MKSLSSFQLWLIFSFFSITAISFLTIGLPYRGDERHFAETINFFFDNFNLQALKDYPEVTPPLFYYLFAAWSKLFGFSIESLRIFNSLISFITWLLLFRLNEHFIKDKIYLFLLTLISVLNPYFLGISAHVFTDMLTINFVLISMISFFKDNYTSFAIFSSMAVLTRQYAVIFPAAVLIYSALSIKQPLGINKKFIIASIVSIIPILILFTIWQNISPKSGIEKWVIQNERTYNADYINSYITFSNIYILPIFAFILKRIKLNSKILLAGVVMSVLISLFPIKTSAATIALTDYRTIGFAHQFLVGILGFESIAIKLLLWILLLIGCVININIIASIIVKIKNKVFEKDLVLYLVWILFLLIMPFSYQVWEKYLTMVIPFYLLSIFVFIYQPYSVQKQITKV